MKKIILTFLIVLLAINSFARTKGTVTVGSDIIKNDDAQNEKIIFGGAYTNFNITADNEYLTASGKFYYRLNSTDSFESLGQKLELKKALLKVRPFGNELFEVAIGKLYSYYLPGNFFNLSEIYTGSSRWGKTGVGFLLNKSGFSFGIGIPLTESYVKISDNFGLNGAIGFDFKTISDDVPVKLGADLIYSNVKQTDETYSKNFSSTVSALFTPSFDGFISKVSLTSSISFNSEPFVSSSVFKNVSNYKNEFLAKSNFCSLNFSANVKDVQFTLEGEAGHSTEGSIIPLYAGTQIGIPLLKNLLSLRPRFFYYAALDSENKDQSRQTFELYPRVWITPGNFIISAGYDFNFKQVSENDWNFEWKVPVFVEYKFGK